MKNKSLRILLAEDNIDDAALLVAMLERGGYEPDVHRIETPEELRKALESREWDLIISDYSMPMFSAPEALGILRELKVEIPAIVVSGTIGEDVAVETLQMGAQDYLLKGSLTRLAAAVERALSESENRRMRRAAEEAVRRDAQIFAQLQESVYCVSYDERIIYWGGGAEATYGWTSGEMLGRHVGELFPRGEEDPDHLRIRKAVKTGRFEGEVRGLRKDGDIVWLELRVHPLIDDTCRKVGHIAVARDISERRRSREELRLRERALAEVSQGVVISDENRCVIYANESFTTITGYDRTEILGRNCAILQGLETDPEKVAFMRRTLDARESFEGVILNYRKDGTKFWNELSISPITGSNDGTVQFIGILRDISVRIEAEEELLNTVERMRVAADSAGVGIFEIDLETEDVRWDDQMFALYGVPEDLEIANGLDRWFRVMSPEDIARCRQVLDEVAHADRDNFEIDFHIRRYGDHELRLIEATGVVRRNHRGEPIRMVGTNRDATVERAREENLAKALAQEQALLRKAQAGERAKGEFLAVMSHEIRTPMNGILGFAELLSQSPELPDSCLDYARTIVASGESLLRILDDVLEFSRLETGRLEIEKKAFRPAQMLDDVRLLLAKGATMKGVGFSVQVDPNVPKTVLGDAGRIRQIVLNLASNAVKFTEKGGVLLELRLGESLPEKTLEFEVRDTGPGIPEDKLGVIFEPFEQAESGSARRHSGAGLGLAISKRLVELLGGSIDVQSEVGEGSTFALRIPFEIPETPTSESAATAPDANFARQHPMKVLVVEDDKVNLKLIRALLRRLGYEAIDAVNGTLAIEVAGREHPDCIFMDLQMPDMDGIDATARIRENERIEKSPRAFVSALTANIFPADRLRCFEAGMDDYLNKPVKIAQLARVLERAHEQRQSNGVPSPSGKS